MQDQAPEDFNKKAEEYLNNWKRAAADLINYKKEEVSRARLLISYAKESMLFNVLPVIDSIYLMEQQTQKLEFSSLLEGLQMIKKQIEEFLKKEGIEEIEVAGQPFNPETMESVGETENGEMELMQKGYKMGEKILRVAKVKVNK